jgi:methylase of polypeptide subunit release factors
MSRELAQALVKAEDRLRALGWTGGQAFDALLPALEERLGLVPAAPAEPAVRALAEALPLEGGGDLLGLAYERFFADLFKGLRGQYFTPEPIGRLLVARLEPRPGEVVLDPTCGSGGLLVHVARTGAQVRGIELDPRLARLASVNLRLSGADGRVLCADFFRSDPDPVDVLVANPPFSVELDDPDLLGRYEMGRGRARLSSDQLFLEAIERWVRPGGRAGLVLPYSILANESAAALRERLDRAWVRTALCALPEGVFRPFGGAAGRAVLLWLQRRPAPPRPCRWAELADPGYDVRSRHYRPTSPAQVHALLEGQGWQELPDGAFTPRASAQGAPLSELCTLVSERCRPSSLGAVVLAELADADRSLGELHPREVDGAELPGVRVAIGAGDVLVSQLRPNLGNVALAPPTGRPLVGSPEWLVLRPVRFPHLLLHLLRTPAWREALPTTTGQTRPRLRSDDVLASAVRWPEQERVGAAVDAVSSRLFEARRRARQALRELQGLVDRYAAGELDEEALLEQLAQVERAHPELPG